MLLEEIRAIKSEKKDLRNFGIIFGVVLGLLGGLLWWKGKDTYTVFAVLSAVFFTCGFLLPSVLKPLQKVWMTLAVVLGWFMTRVILGILFYLVFFTISAISRILLRKQFLDLKINKSEGSYWIRRESSSSDATRYEKQF